MILPRKAIYMYLYKGTDTCIFPEQVYVTPEYVRYEKQRNMMHWPEQTDIDMM